MSAPSSATARPAPIERAVGAERAGDDARAAREVEAAARVDLGLRGGEERLAEAERDRAADDREREVEQVRDRRDRAADERAGARAHLGRRFGRRPAGDARDRGARRLGLEAAARAAPAHRARRARR